MKSVRDRDIGEVLQDGALHSQLVEISVEEGDDSLGEWRGTFEVHDDRDVVGEPDLEKEWGTGSYLWSRCVFMRMECCMGNYLKGGEACLKGSKEASCRRVAESVAND